MAQHTVMMTPRQTELYLSSSKSERAVAVAQVKTTIRDMNLKPGTPILVVTINGTECWRDAA